MKKEKYRHNKSIDKKGNIYMYNKCIKRLIDIIVSIIGLIVFSPICILISIMIKVVDKSPIIYMQDRTGLHGKNFKIYKFTTMKNGEVTKIR